MPCIFTISANSLVKVKFDPTPTKTLTVNLTGPAAFKGKVKGKAFVKGLVSAGISCGSGCTMTTESFFVTDTIELVRCQRPATRSRAGPSKAAVPVPARAKP